MHYPRLGVAWALLIALAFRTGIAAADVFRSDTGAVIPGTEGIEPGPGVQLDHRNLQFADLRDRDLTEANLAHSNLARARLWDSMFTNTNLAGANLTGASLQSSTLAGADLTGAVVTQTSFSQTTSQGFTREQLYSTASYQVKDLYGIGLSSNDLAGWDLSGQNLQFAHFGDSVLTGADLRGANLSGANFTRAWLASANMAGAAIVGARFQGTSSQGFTKEQLYSTASYQEKDLRGIGLGGAHPRDYYSDYPLPHVLTGWDFSGQNLTGAEFSLAWLIDADFTGADLTGANLRSAVLFRAKFVGAVVTRADFNNLDKPTSLGLTKEQLYATASYAAKDLQGITLAGNNLSGWDFSGQNLAGAALYQTTLRNARFAGAIVAGALFSDTTSRGFAKEQLYATASYRTKNLQRIVLADNDLTGWDFSGQDLTGGLLIRAVLANANLQGAVVKGVHFSSSEGFTKEQLYSTASYEAKNLQGVILPDNLDLNGWDFSGQNLAGAWLLRLGPSTNLADAIVTGAHLGAVTREQLYSTASYHAKYLQGIDLSASNFSGWDLSGQFLGDAKLGDLSAADLQWTDLRGAIVQQLPSANIQNFINPSGFVDGLTVADDQVFVIRDHDGGGGTIWGRLPPIPVKVRSTATFSSASRTQLVFEADAWNSLISFEPGIPVQLGGALELTFSGDVDAADQVGRTLRLFDWAGVSPSGSFQVTTPYDWDLSRLYTTGEVTLLAVPEPLAALLWFPCVGFTARATSRRRR
jgi:uncharacterized protein YjbI with pentapeptide repeats